MNFIPVVVDLITLNNLLYDIDIVDGNNIGELARQTVQKYKYTARLLRCNKHLVMRATLEHTFNLFVVLIVRFASESH